MHFAAESHVDRSILDSTAFIKTNVLGTQCLLDAARHAGIKRFVLVSTDEVYGSAPTGEKFTETSHLAPNSPYASSKAGADLLARAYFRTYGFPVIITRCTNNYGPYQYPEKFIPLIISRAMQGESIPVYGDGLQIRDWIHVMDHCAGLDAVLHEGREGEIYNLGAGNEWTNLDIARHILKLVGKSESLLKYVQDRPGHDRRYALEERQGGKGTGLVAANFARRWTEADGRLVPFEFATGSRRSRRAPIALTMRKQYDRREATMKKVLEPRRKKVVRVLVTGAKGMLAHALLPCLVGHDVTGVDLERFRYLSGSRRAKGVSRDASGICLSPRCLHRCRRLREES